MLKHGFIYLALGLLAALTSGCVTKNIDSAAASQIHRIAVAGPDGPTSYSLAVGGMAGMDSESAVNNGPRTEAARAMTSAMASQGVKLGEELQTALIAALNKNGYQATRVDAVRSRPGSYVQSYSNYSTSADAVLDLTFSAVGYERRVWGKIAPKVVLTARMADTHSGAILMSKYFVYDRSAKTIGTTILRPDERFAFDTEEEVLSHPDLAAAGLRASIPVIVDGFVASLRK